MRNIQIVKKLVCIFIWMLFLGWTDGKSAPLVESYHFSQLGLKEGLSQLSVLKIYQDSKGYIWFATRNGLNKYDGSRMKIYKHRNGDSLSIDNNDITTMVEDPYQQLWVGTSRGLNRLDLSKDEVTTIPKGDKLLDSGVRTLFVDSQERLWIGTGRGLKLYVREANVFQTIDLGGAVKDEYITCIYETSDHQLWIATQNKGIFVCTMDLIVQEHYSKESGNHHLPDNNVAAIHEDKDGNVWLGTLSGGVSCIDKQTGNIKTYSVDNSILTTNNIRCFEEEGDLLFIGTFEGLYAMDLTDRTLSAISTASMEKGNLSHFSVYSLYVDKEGTLWVGTYAGGVNYYNKYSNRFSFYDPTQETDAFLGIYGAMVCKAPHCLYIATEGAGVLDYNLSSHKFRYYLYDTSTERLAHSKNIVKSVALDGNIVWCGTTLGTIYQFDTKTKKFKQYCTLPQSASIYSIIPTSDNEVWVASSKPGIGLVKITEDGKFKTEFEVEGEETPWKLNSLRCLCRLDNGDILIGSRNNGLFKYNEKTQERTVYDTKSIGSHHLESDYVTSIIRTLSGKVWISTYGGGIAQLDCESGIVQTVTTKDGLVENDVCAVVEDKAGNLWMSIGSYISMYNPVTGEVYNYKQVASAGVQEFTPHSGMLLPNGHICFGASNGFVVFNPEDILLNTYQSPLVLTDLKVNDGVEVPGKSDFLSYTLDDTQEIELKYDQNNLSIGYCALNYIYPEHNQYAFRLKGYDDEWHNVGNRREAYYTNLNPGEYVFEVKASNNDGVWGEQIRTLHIVINPPLWKTWYAYIFYVIVFVGICFIIMYYIVKKRTLEQTLHYKQLEQKQSEEFHQQKIRMFTNFSHELRTPLTLIISPLQELLQKKEFESSVRNKLSLIYNNSQRLLLLVNQLMDLRKNQSGKMQLKIVKEDISSFVKEIYYAFNQLAINKNIDLVYECTEERIPAWFDKTLFEKVIFNLLSNAFKYTPEGGQIGISLKKLMWKQLDENCRKELGSMSDDAGFIHLIISDTGKGVPEKEMKNIFTPFYQIEDEQSKNMVGTGIGLSLTHSIVQLHHGMIWVQNRMQGGAEFHVVFPVDRAVYKEDEIDKEAAGRVVLDVIPSVASKAPSIELERKFNILLVEDNDEVRTYVKECMEPYFNVEEADNGEMAYEMVLKNYPDLVVSDIMMPKKDGLELCCLIKNDIQTEHIPVILMTAKSMVMHIKEGFSCGADDYIVKPFNMDVLLYRIKNILESREKLKKVYGKKFSPEALGIEIASNDDRFTQKFFGIIEQNIANPELNIDMICKELGLSRTNLYRKLKAITELSPIELIKNKRLEVAAKLLIESNCPVAEVSELVGFNGHAYFSQCFKSVYGYSPTEFVRVHKNNS